jgi:hypothetical protein
MRTFNVSNLTDRSSIRLPTDVIPSHFLDSYQGWMMSWRLKQGDPSVAPDELHTMNDRDDLITGDEIWVYLDMKPGTIWLPADAELPVRVKRTITSEKRMLIVFWGIHEIAHYCWLRKDSTLDSPFFRE